MKKKIIIAVIITILAGAFSFQEWQISKLNTVVSSDNKLLGQVVTFLNQVIAQQPKQ